ncbi:MAG: HPF/RaiA family ribosome-associated protein [Candidatus Berkelbacteria bacterium]|nr:HPF/RaiA family ribosome-associated protein [Candidatus Berkelbacteria bacterium]
MKIEFHTKEIVLSARDKSLMERKLRKLKRYLKDEPMLIDVFLRDETSAEKGGVDQAVEISTNFGKEKIFVREVDDRLMRAFAYAYKGIERNLSRFHRKRIKEAQKFDENKLAKILRKLRIGGAEEI